MAVSAFHHQGHGIHVILSLFEFLPDVFAINLLDFDAGYLRGDHRLENTSGHTKQEVARGF